MRAEKVAGQWNFVESGASWKDRAALFNIALAITFTLLNLFSGELHRACVSGASVAHLKIHTPDMSLHCEELDVPPTISPVSNQDLQSWDRMKHVQLKTISTSIRIRPFRLMYPACLSVSAMLRDPSPSWGDGVAISR